MHQYLFFIGDFPIRAYGLVLSLSIILATGVAYFLAKKDGRYSEHIVNLGIVCGICGIIGARLWDVFFFDWVYYGHHLTELFNVWQGGMAIQGGVVFGALGAIVYAKKYNLDVLALADILAPAVILGQAIGRCANLLNGDAFGAPTGSSFGIIYPTTTLAYHTYGAQPLWPAEVWEGQLDFVIFALLLIYKAFPHAKGKVFGLYIMLYSLVRFGLEFLRGDYAKHVFLSFTSAQTTSLVAFTLALIFFIYCTIKYKPVEDELNSKTEPEIKVNSRNKRRGK